MKKKVIVLIVVAFLSSANAVVVDNFESYALDTVMDNGVGGWSIYGGFNANTSSPVVKDSASYSEFNGQFLMLKDDNSYANSSEAINKNTPVALTKDGDYLQVAVYISSETINGATASGSLIVRLEDEFLHPMTSGGIAWRQFTYTDNGVTRYTALRPSFNTWYVLRSTLRDGNSDGVVDSWDFDVFDAYMNPYTSAHAIALSYTTATSVTLSCAGTSAKGIALVDEITIIPEPATVILLSIGGFIFAGRKH
ncbi:MAG: hypothetical protein A2X47_00060 [Lentisphaerae bacterium GWF2_38_69]|nr:MAG: hypothetical protein A2X47_00060 [Lentisphaerae bacterium GWF2_38_69]HBG27892.1 hypothetical protein [Phycisphaerales bacterium]